MTTKTETLTVATARDTELGIDLLRGIAAVLVLVSHGIGNALKVPFGDVIASYPPWARLLASTLGYGAFSVWGFFVISGFCIQQSVERSIARGRFNSWSYARARLTRIYPLFLLGLALAVVGWFATSAYGHPGEVFPLKRLLGNAVFLDLFPAFVPSWSLTNEMFYYLAWPLGLALCGWRQKAAVGWLAAVSMAVVAMVFVIWKRWYGGAGDHWLVNVWSILVWFMVWLGGAVLGIYFRQLQAWATPRRVALALLWLAVMYACQAANYYHAGKASIHALIGFMVTPGFMVVIAGAHHWRLAANAVSARIAAWLGDLSYPCYILHMPLLEMVARLLIPDALAAYPTISCIVTTLSVLAIVSTAGIAAERAVMRWRKRVLRPVRPAVTVLQPAELVALTPQAPLVE